MESHTAESAARTRRAPLLDRLLGRLQAHDPERALLKSALRAAIFLPSVFAFADNVIGDPNSENPPALSYLMPMNRADFYWRSTR